MNHKTLKILGGALLGAATAGVLMYSFLSARKVPREPASRGEMLPEGVDLLLEGPSRLTAMAEGVMEWTLAADQVRFHAGEKTARVKNPRAVIPLAHGGTVELQAEEGFYYQSSGDMRLEGEVEVILEKNGERKWRLEGRSARYQKSEDAFYLLGLSGRLRPSGGTPVAVSADQGRYNRTSEEMTLTGNVVCRDERGVKLETDSLKYRTRDSTAVTKDAVRIRGPGFSLSGRGLYADLARNAVEIKREVALRLDRGMGGGISR